MSHGPSLALEDRCHKLRKIVVSHATVGFVFWSRGQADHLGHGSPLLATLDCGLGYPVRQSGTVQLWEFVNKNTGIEMTLYL